MTALGGHIASRPARPVRGERVRSLLIRLTSGAPYSGPVIAASMGLGFLVGAVAGPVPGVTLHSVQAVAGVVHLPLTSATQINETSTYSLVLVQLPAIPLALGVSESTLAVLLSGVQGAVFFGAVVAVCLALSENTLLAALAPFLVIQLRSVPGHQYPVPVVASHYDAAVLGLFAALLTVGLLALRRAKSGLFLLGVLPAIHLSYGIACLIFTAAGLGAARRTHLAPFRAAWKYFAGGVAVFAVSFGVQVLAIRHIPPGIDMHHA